jgi:hypothetical protein
VSSGNVDEREIEFESCQASGTPYAVTPFNDRLMISLPDVLLKDGDLQFRLMNISGVTVASGRLVPSNQIWIDSIYCSPGLYILLLETEGDPIVLKVVKLD